MELPSPELVARLGSLGLCTSRDFRSCAARVRRLAQDLPPFDDVWIDALVQQRVLTRFQGDALSDSRGQSVGVGFPGDGFLRVGPFLLEDHAGAIVGGTEYRGLHRQTGAFAQIVLVDPDPRSGTEQLERMQVAIRHWSGLSHPALALSTAANEDQGRTAVVSNWVAGERMSDLLVRRGRFPIDVVTEIARQLAAGLAALERVGGLHGDLRIRNVRLTPKGQAVLVNTGLRPALRPYISLHDRLSPDAYENIAPELIRIGETATGLSDIYALGCLLWQLLAGRPPFTMGDPLAMLAAHQSRQIDDVRHWVPDTPSHLAKLIAAMTQRDPAQRPASFAEISATVGPPQRRGTRRLQKFARAFESAAPVQRTVPAGDGVWHRSRLLAAGVLLAVVCSVMFHHGIRSSLVRITGDFWSQRAAAPSPPAASAGDNVANGAQAESNTTTQQGTAEHRPQSVATTQRGTGVQTAALISDRISSPTDASRLPLESGTVTNAGDLFALPEVDDGVILLKHRGPFAAAERSTVGPLTLRAANGVQPVIIVRNEPLKLWGSQVIVDGVHVQRQANATDATGPMIEILAQSFGMLESQVIDRTTGVVDANPNGTDRRSESVGSTSETTESGNRSAAIKVANVPCIRWQLLDPVGPERGRIGWSRSVVRSDGPALECTSLPETVQMQGVLKTGQGVLIGLPQPASEPAMSSQPDVLGVTLRHCTLRGNRAILRVEMGDRTSIPHNIRINAEQTLVAPATDYGLVLVASPDGGERTADVRRLLRSIFFTGSESYLQENSPLAVLEKTTPADATDVKVLINESMDRPAALDMPHVEGLKSANLRFRGVEDGLPANSLLLLPAEPGYEGSSPGIEPDAFAAPAQSAYNPTPTPESDER